MPASSIYGQNQAGSAQAKFIRQWLLIQALRQMEQQQQAPQAGQGKDSGSSLKDAANIYKEISGQGGGSSAASALGGGMAGAAITPASQAAWNSGAGAVALPAGSSSLETVVGNGLYSEAPGAMQASSAAANGAAAGGIPLFDVGGPSYAGALGSAIQLGMGVKDVLGNKLSDEQKTTRAKQQAGLAVANYFTGGLAGLADAAARKIPVTNKIVSMAEKLDQKTNPITLGVNKFATSNAYKTEGNRLKKLEDNGAVIPEGWKTAESLTRGRPLKSLVNPDYAPDYVGQATNGQTGWVNNKFANSRNVADLQPDDIVGYAAFGEKLGNNWYKLNLDQQRQVAKSLLDKKGVSEGKGTINLNWDPESEKTAQALIGKIPAPVNVNKPQPLAPGQTANSVVGAASGMMAKPGMVPPGTSPSSLINAVSGMTKPYMIPKVRR